jgi:hypothetical protein
VENIRWNTIAAVVPFGTDGTGQLVNTVYCTDGRVYHHRAAGGEDAWTSCDPPVPGSEAAAAVERNRGGMQLGRAT